MFRFTLSIVVTIAVCLSIISVQCKTSSERGDYRQHSIRMISDVLHHERIPTNVFLVTCWTPAQNAVAYRSLNYPASFRPVHEPFTLSADVNRNVVMVIVDLDCGWSEGWFAEVCVNDNNNFNSGGGDKLTVGINIMQVDPSYLELPIRWLILTPHQLAEHEQPWYNVPMWVDSHVTLATWNATDRSYRLEQCKQCAMCAMAVPMAPHVFDSLCIELSIDYKIHEEFGVVVGEVFGTWNAGEQPRLNDQRESRILSRRRRNLQQCPMQASIVILNNASLDHLTDYK